jgi:RES domain-containing protein
LRFRGTCYRAHDPKLSFKPISGEGAAIHGGRFNPKAMEALYLGLTIGCAINEANQGFAFKINPCVLCCYDVDCDDIADLRTDTGRTRHGVTLADMSCPWAADLADGSDPPSWAIARRLVAERWAGILVPSFAAGANPEDQNFVLWDWSGDPPHQVRVFDPSGRLPKNQLSWD